MCKGDTHFTHMLYEHVSMQIFDDVQPCIHTLARASSIFTNKDRCMCRCCSVSLFVVVFVQKPVAAVVVVVVVVVVAADKGTCH